MYIGIHGIIKQDGNLPISISPYMESSLNGLDSLRFHSRL